jgi:rod shape-determining protein MreC
VTGTGKGQSGAGLLKLQVLGGGGELRRGEQLVTSASVRDRPYVPGVPVGVVSQVQSSEGTLTARALVRPYADFAALGVVGIVVAPPRRNPRFSVLPQDPKPTPTVTVTVTPQPSPSLAGAPSAVAGG